MKVLSLWVIETSTESKIKIQDEPEQYNLQYKAVNYSLDFQNNVLQRCKVIQENKALFIPARLPQA